MAWPLAEPYFDPTAQILQPCRSWRPAGTPPLLPGHWRPRADFHPCCRREEPEGTDHTAEGPATPVSGGEVEEGGEGGLVEGRPVRSHHVRSQLLLGASHRFRIWMRRSIAPDAMAAS